MLRLDTSHSQFLEQPASLGLPPKAVLLRGVNVSSASKFPHDHVSEDIWSEAEQGGQNGWFVDRPLAEKDFDHHFSRLSSWGFNAIRLIVTWEALEPFPYNEAYISYLTRLLYKCKQYSIRVFISPHQDVFSRFAGGSGAPIWALEALGLAPRRVHDTCAALLHHMWDGEGYGGREGREEVVKGKLGPYPDMLWNSNLHRLASRHCFTMFFASHVFAPKCRIDGVSASEWLQKHHVDAYGHLADSLPQDLLDSCLIGWDTINEPHEGFIGIPDLESIPPSQQFRKGPSPDPLQAFQLGVGQSVSSIAYDDFTALGHKKLGNVTISPSKGVWMTEAEKDLAERRYGWKWGSEWRFWDQGGCPWAGHGVWSPSSAKILQPQYFERKAGGDKHDFTEDFLRPHHEAFIRRIRQAHPNAIIFVNPPIFAQPPRLKGKLTEGRVAISPHFYDGLTMLGKRRHKFNADAVALQRGQVGMLGAVKIGSKSIRSGLRSQLRELKNDGLIGRDEELGGTEYPVIIGETGVPFDMKPTGLLGFGKGKRDAQDYTEPIKAMDELLDACDGDNALSYMIWAYEPKNNMKVGDNWNGEDLSIVSLDAAGKSVPRGIQAWCRPYPVETMGRVKEFSFDMSKTVFALSIQVYSAKTSSLWHHQGGPETEGYSRIYLPFVHYGPRESEEQNEKDEPMAKWNRIRIIEISDGRLMVEGQWAWWYYSLECDRLITLRICRSD